jgi:hypothetical protein
MNKLVLLIDVSVVFTLLAMSSLSMTLAANNITNTFFQGYRNLDNDTAIQTLRVQ